MMHTFINSYFPSLYVKVQTYIDKFKKYNLDSYEVITVSGKPFLKMDLNHYSFNNEI